MFGLECDDKAPAGMSRAYSEGGATGVSSMDAFWKDVKFGVRMLLRSPGFMATAILTLALGIGANTALFSVVNGVLLNPLSFPHANELVALYENKPHFEYGSISYPNFLDWQRNNRTFQLIAAYRPDDFTVAAPGILNE
jgi:hypothetical protein